jgi:hypothetical protein
VEVRVKRHADGVKDWRESNRWAAVINGGSDKVHIEDDGFILRMLMDQRKVRL